MAAVEALIGSQPQQTVRGLAKATVAADFEPVTDLLVTVDGDSATTHATSLVGELQADQRVMIMFVRPQAAFVVALLHPPAWRPLVMELGWSNNGSGTTTAAIRRVNDRVEMRGLISRSGLQTVIANLRPGFVPPDAESFVAEAYHVADDPAGDVADLFVIGTQLLYGGGAHAESYLSLSQVTYSVTPTA